jgi:TetR/AcrR family transcriptional regulator
LSTERLTNSAILLTTCYDPDVSTPANAPDNGEQPPSPAAPRPRRAPAPEDRQQDADRSRRLLLAAALEEFSAKGYAGARVQEIAARAGVNKQLINYYFNNKEGLYLELQRTWLSRERTFADPDLPLDELAVRYLHDALTEPRLTRLLAWRGLTDHTQPTPDSTGDNLADVSTLHARQTTGELADDLDPASVRLAIMGAVMIPVVMPQLVRRIFGLDPTDPEFESRYGEHLRQMIRRLAPAPHGAVRTDDSAVPPVDSPNRSASTGPTSPG